MTLQHTEFYDGEANTTTDHQRVADDAATADDAALEALLTPGATLKRVVPLSAETAAQDPTLLIIPSSANQKVTVQPCKFVVGSDAYTIALAASQKTSWESAAFVNTDPTNFRIDLVYATVTTADTTESRKQKDKTTGIVSTQSLVTLKTPSITFTVLQGTPAASPTAPALPADTTGVYNFALAHVYVDPNSGTFITQDYIIPQWVSGAVARRRLPLLRAGTPVLYPDVTGGTTTGENIPNKLANGNWGAGLAVYQLLTATAPPVNGIVVDNSADWRFRLIWGFSCLPPADGSTHYARLPDSGANGSFDSAAFPLGMTGNGGSTASTNGNGINLYADATTGYLMANITSSPTVGNAINWNVIVFGTDPFKS